VDLSDDLMIDPQRQQFIQVSMKSSIS